MITHSIPHGDAAPETASVGMARTPAVRAGAAPKRPAGVGGYGPLRVQLHLTARHQRAGLDPGPVPRRSRARRIRGALLLSDSRPSGARCRRQRVARGNRDSDRALSALFGGARAVFGGALRHERSAQDRRRGQGDSHRAAQESRRHQGRDHLCRSGPQVSDLGAGPLPLGTPGGHREGSRAQAAAGFPGSGGRPARSTEMMASRDSAGAVAGGLARHIPVLGRSVVELLDVRAGAIYVDATFGAGGHSSAILAAANCNVIAIDRDPNAIARGADLARSARDRLALVEDNFSDLQAVVRNCGYEAIDGVVFDLGVSSMQLDEGARGFSFRHEGPLDMRMSRDGPTAADVVASASERELAAIIAALGEERHARRLARARPRRDQDQSPRALGRPARSRAHRRGKSCWPHHALAAALAIIERGRGTPRNGAAAMMRVLNICVIVALVLAAADVYTIKFQSTRQAQRVAKLRLEIRRERDAVAALRAEWAKLDNPARIQDLARRHLPLVPVEPRQIDPLDNLPERPSDLVAVDEVDPIGAVISNPDAVDRYVTGSVPADTR